ELKERIAADRTQRAHIGVARSVDEPDQRPDDAAGKELMPGHAARLALAARARRNDEIAVTGRNRRDQGGDGAWIVGAVAGQVREEVGVGGVGAGKPRASIAVPDRDPLRARLSRALARAVAAAAVGDNNAIDNVARQRGDDRAD